MEQKKINNLSTAQKCFVSLCGSKNYFIPACLDVQMLVPLPLLHPQDLPVLFHSLVLSHGPDSETPLQRCIMRSLQISSKRHTAEQSNWESQFTENTTTQALGIWINICEKLTCFFRSKQKTSVFSKYFLQKNYLLEDFDWTAFKSKEEILILITSPYTCRAAQATTLIACCISVSPTATALLGNKPSP